MKKTGLIVFLSRFSSGYTGIGHCLRFLAFPSLLVLLGTLTTCPAESQTPVPVISSGRVNTLGKFSFQYGSIEARIKMPATANGLWPAFWLLGADHETVGWPGCGEIDIVEMGGDKGITKRQQATLFDQSCHWGSNTPGGLFSYTMGFVAPASLQNGFHLYRMDWNASRISMFVDGLPYFVMDINDAVSAYFQKPFSILLNLAVGGDYMGIYNADKITALNKGNNFSAAMYIDYVRVKDEQGNITWNDEFNGPLLDESKWNIEVNDSGGGNHELQSYRRGNVSIGNAPGTNDSCLIITAKRE